VNFKSQCSSANDQTNSKFQILDIGSCSNLENRLKQHNNGKTRSTKSATPWILVYREFFDTRHEAYKREKQIKSYKGGEAFRKLLLK